MLSSCAKEFFDVDIMSHLCSPGCYGDCDSSQPEKVIRHSRLECLSFMILVWLYCLLALLEFVID